MTSTVTLIGNPNCGKSALFNRLTGVSQRVGNWAGVTVERKEGRYRHDEDDVVAVDLPGVYSLDAADEACGVDVRIALDYLLTGAPDAVVNVVDASNLERNLYLTVQLLELGLPVVVALTMRDVPAARRRPADPAELSERLGCPVVPVDPRRGRGVDRLRDAIGATLQQPGRTYPRPAYPAAVEAALQALDSPLAATADEAVGARRWRALALLAGDAGPLPPHLERVVAEQRAALERSLGEDVDIVLADSRYGLARELVQAVTHEAGELSVTATDRLDSIVLNRWLGIPVFLAAMYLLFMVTIKLGGAFVDFFDILAGALFVDGLGALLSRVGAPDPVRVVLADGAGGGVQTVATFIPIVGVLFLFLSALEDSGYMARAAFVMDRLMRLIGLPGRSFVPLLLGFGCNVPAVLATRALESRRDRYLTIMMNPFMSCGARLPVYALFAAAFFPAVGQNVVFALYLIGMAAAVFTGLALRSTLLRGRPTPFVMELPPYHAPAPHSLLLHTWARLRGFALGAGRVIVAMVVVLTVLGSITTSGSFEQDGRASVLDSASRAVTPALAPLGVREENWPATVGVVTGVFAKEALVGTLDSLYSSLADGSAEEGSFSPWRDARAAVASVGSNLGALADEALDPLGVSIAERGSRQAAAEEQGVAVGTFAEITRRFDGGAGAFAYLLFVLLYAPCAAATGAIYRETSVGWTLFAVFWTTGLAYVISTIAYQGATLGRHPASSLAWIAGALVALGLALAVMRVVGSRRLRPGSRRTSHGLPVPALGGGSGPGVAKQPS
ncbi:MAG: Fe(2+) transporter permease subunit FeoB [Nocardioidaceae bacterium]